jgi:hypothetical protein
VIHMCAFRDTFVTTRPYIQIMKTFLLFAAVLLFAADWCPYCQADLKDINANGSRLGGVTIVVVDGILSHVKRG